MSYKTVNIRRRGDTRGGTSGVSWLVVVLSVVAGVVAIHLLALNGVSHGPVLYSDALGYLGNARFLAGGAPPTFDGTFAYNPGYSLLFIPIYWFTTDTVVIWRIAEMMNVAFATLIMLPAFILGRNVFNLNREKALLASVATSLTPALILQPSRVSIEVIFPLLFMFSIVALLTFYRRQNTASGITTGLLIGYLVAVHGRGLVVAGALCVILLLGVLLKKLPLTQSLLSVGAMTAVIAAEITLRSYLREELWSAGTNPLNANSVTRILGAFGPEHLKGTISTALGHLWYSAATSFGVTVVGAVALLLIVAGSKHFRGEQDAKRAVVLFALISIAGTALISAGLLTRVNEVHHRVWGRYLEGVTPFLVLAGTAYLLRVRQAWRILAYASLSVLISGVALYYIRGSEEFFGVLVTLPVPGLIGLKEIVSYGENVIGMVEYLDVIGISVLTAAVGVVVALITRTRQVAGVMAVILVTVSITFFGKVTSWDPFIAFAYDWYRDVATALDDVPDDRAVYYDLEYLNTDARNFYEFEFAPRSLIYIESMCEAEQGSYVISTSETLRGGVSALLVTSVQNTSQGLWNITGEPSNTCG